MKHTKHENCLRGAKAGKYDPSQCRVCWLEANSAKWANAELPPRSVTVTRVDFSKLPRGKPCCGGQMPYAVASLPPKG